MGSELKPVWSTWDAQNRPVYIRSIRWYRTDQASGEGWALIEGETGLEYTIRPEDAGKFIKCELDGVVASGEYIELAPASSEMTKRLLEK